MPEIEELILEHSKSLESALGTGSCQWTNRFSVLMKDSGTDMWPAMYAKNHDERLGDVTP